MKQYMPMKKKDKTSENEFIYFPTELLNKLLELGPTKFEQEMIIILHMSDEEFNEYLNSKGYEPYVRTG